MRRASILIVTGLVLACLSAPVSALNAPTVPGSVEAAIAEGVGLAQHAVNLGTDERVHSAGHELEALITGQIPVFTPKLHKVQYMEVDGSASTIEKILEENDSQLGKTKAFTDLHGAQRLQRHMYKDGRMGFDSSLDALEMGVFRFNRGRGHEGTIGLNTILSEIGKKIGHALVAATLFHEAGHAADAAIDETGVIDGEIPAFQLQYAWLKLIDPTGEKVALLRVALAEQHQLYPTSVSKIALDYVRTLNVLAGTGGDPEKIKVFIKQLGYVEGHGKPPVPVPQA